MLLCSSCSEACQAPARHQLHAMKPYQHVLPTSSTVADVVGACRSGCPPRHAWTHSPIFESSPATVQWRLGLLNVFFVFLKLLFWQESCFQGGCATSSEITTPRRGHLTMWVQKLTQSGLNGVFGEGRLKDEFSFFEAYKNPITRARTLLAKRPFISKSALFTIPFKLDRISFPTPDLNRHRILHHHDCWVCLAITLYPGAPKLLK